MFQTKLEKKTNNSTFPILHYNQVDYHYILFLPPCSILLRNTFLFSSQQTSSSIRNHTRNSNLGTHQELAGFHKARPLIYIESLQIFDFRLLIVIPYVKSPKGLIPGYFSYKILQKPLHNFPDALRLIYPKSIWFWYKGGADVSIQL